MAKQQIFETTLYNFEQQEAFDEYGIQTQEYFRAWVTLEVTAEFDGKQNRTEFTPNVYLNMFSNTSSYTLKEGANCYAIMTTSNMSHNVWDEYTVKTEEEFEPNQVNRIKISRFYDTGHAGSNIFELDIPHYFTNCTAAASLSISVDTAFRIKGIKGFSNVGSDGYKRFNNSSDFVEVTFPDATRGINFVTATNFTDEQNPSVTYSYDVLDMNYILERSCEFAEDDDLDTETVDKIELALSLDGVNPIISYREVDLNNSNFTIDLTEEERETIRIKVQGSNIVPIYYLARVTRTASSSKGDKYATSITSVFYSKAQRTLTIVGSKPTLNPTIKDIKSETLALTGNENIFVKHESMVEFSTGATPSKHATIVSQSVENGTQRITNMYYGVIQNIESPDFIFNATDSRGLNADTVVISNVGMINYIKPTCYQELDIGMSGETDVTVTIKNTGSYFNGSFGAVHNTLKLEARYKEGNGEYGEWITLTGTPTFKDGKYELISTFTNLPYKTTYTWQCRATDKLNTVTTQSYVLKLYPVFDWSENDFNFNVPVNITGGELNMNNKTIIRHSTDTNNTVLAASGGHIYLRPGGTTSTTGETIIYPNGAIKFGGTVDFANGLTINNNSIEDYVIETGTESMGSNGTWYWQKWASGKAECWGCRNYGKMAITTAWGNLYRSDIFSQELPDDVFITTPDVININLVNISNGAWIVKHENTAPSAVTTGSFIVVRPASATPTISYIGFHVIGLWKQD